MSVILAGNNMCRKATSAWIDNVGTQVIQSSPGTVTDVTTDPEHKSFANGAYINFSGGSTTAAMRVRFRFRRDSGATSYKGLYTRSSVVETRGSLWTQGGRFLVYASGPTAGWNVLFSPSNMYNTWFWADIWHSGTSMTVRIHDGGTETDMGSQLYSGTFTITSTGAYNTVRLMAGWNDATWAGNGDLGTVYYNVGATNENWTSIFYPFSGYRIT